MNRKKRPSRTISEDKVKMRCDQLGLIYVRTYVKNKKTQVVYLCPKHLSKGEISSAWCHLSTGKYGCPYCSGKYKTTDDLKEELRLIQPNIEILGEYKSARTKILTRCLVCGHEWLPVPNALLNGFGCPICGKRKRAKAKTKTQDEFERDLNSVAPHIIVVDQYKGSHNKIKCRCSVHNIEWESYPANLLNKSAGCPMCAIERFNNTPSRGEQKITQWLDANNIEYFTEYTMSGCTYKRNLRFDFYIPNLNMVIEFDGEQHFRPINRFSNAQEAFLETQARDDAKNSYCRTHGIHMLRIPYTDYNKIEHILNSKIKEIELSH